MDFVAKQREIEAKLHELAQQHAEAQALLNRIIEQQIGLTAQYQLLAEMVADMQPIESGE
jgi:hypothetical protein